MYREKIKQICREVLEDSIMQACGLDSEPSNQYIAAMRKVFQQRAGTEDIEEQLAKKYQESISGRAKSWKDVEDFYFYIHAITRNTAAGADAESVARSAIKHYQPLLLNCVLGWIIGLRGNGGWDNFLCYRNQSDCYMTG